MLAIPSSSDERLTAVRRSKFAYVYVRQSSISQVRHHQESTELQYSLVDRAVRLGWPPDRVVVIDEDLGKSGNGQVERGGFQRLIAEIGLGNTGLVVSLDASRLARNNRDWHQLLELCSLFGVVIADGERLYDPRLSRPAAVRALGDHERSGVAPDPHPPASRGAAEGCAGRASHTAARWLDLQPLRPDRVQP
ncbi:recombinase family protein [Mesorhizobium sp.]|uniref:recombinase family protein n=1 Tax=Mesorhizobium sp. TaxID=1871066 RepID=UPI003418AF0E